MAILVSLLYGGVVRCGNQNVIATFDSLLLYGSRYVSEILAATLTPNPNPNGVTPTCCRLYNPREPAKRCNPNLLSVV